MISDDLEVYKPSEVLFFVQEEEDMECVVVYTCPEEFWIQNGYMDDQHYSIENFNLPNLQEGMFESSDDVEITKQKLLALGLRQDSEFDEFVKGCV